MWLTLLIAITLPFSLFSQATLEYYDAESDYKEALAFYQQKNYIAAKPLFKNVINKGEHLLSNNQVVLIGNAKYFEAICALELYQPDTEKLLLDFIYSEHETVYKRLAYYFLGKYYFREKRYSKAINWFEQVKESDLSKSEFAEYQFQTAYCYFFRKKFDEAEKLLDKTKLVTNKYYYPSNYYYGYIMYEKGQYDEALESFKIVEESNIYSKITPFYISQIYFYKKQYNNLTNYLPPILEDKKVIYYAELNQLLGQTYFEQSKYEKALKYLSIYETENRKIRAEDAYQLGYSYYKTGNTSQTIEYFEELGDRTDTIGQNSLYILADCYIINKQPENARSAYLKASMLEYDKDIVEASKFNYGKLSYELGYDKEAIALFITYNEDYPNSKNAVETKELLTDLFLTTRDYSNALSIIESMENRTPKINSAYQEVSYSRGVELFNEKQYAEANLLFDVSLKNQINPGLAALAYYWKGEAHYRSGNYKPATWQYSRFLSLAPASDINNKDWYLVNAAYGNGYAFLKQNDYKRAYVQFQEAINAAKGVQNFEISKRVMPDALIRSGDCSFLLKNYGDALASYNKVINGNLNGINYALYQSGIIAGLQGHDNDKIKLLKLINPKSLYADDAQYAIGVTYFNTGKTDAAIATFKKLVSDYYKKSPYFTQALLKLGHIAYNSDKYDKAVKNYYEVLNLYPKSADALEAIEGCRNISIATANPKVYETALKKAGRNLDTAEQDSIMFLAAESQFNQGDFKEAIKRLNTYINQYSDGNFVLQAHFYRGESLFYTEEKIASLPDYEFVIEAGGGRFYEKTLVKAAGISLYELKDYSKANKYYSYLIEIASFKDNKYNANLGLMRSHYYLEQFTQVSNYANNIINSKDAKPSHILEAHYFLGKIEMQNKAYNAALPHLNFVVEKTTGYKHVESLYALAYILYTEEKFEKSIEASNKVIEFESKYEKWIVKAYLLISDNYVGIDNLFQAKATLESVITNTTIEELKKIAQEKYNAILEKEAADSNIIPQDTTDILQEDTTRLIDIENQEEVPDEE